MQCNDRTLVNGFSCRIGHIRSRASAWCRAWCRLRHTTRGPGAVLKTRRTAGARQEAGLANSNVLCRDGSKVAGGLLTGRFLHGPGRRRSRAPYAALARPHALSLKKGGGSTAEKAVPCKERQCLRQKKGGGSTIERQCRSRTLQVSAGELIEPQPAPLLLPHSPPGLGRRGLALQVRKAKALA